MKFLFGSKYPIFNEKGQIQHDRESFVKEWKNRYKKDPNYDWKNHKGIQFSEEEK